MRTAVALMAFFLPATAGPAPAPALALPQTQDLNGETVGEKGKRISGAVCTLTANRHGDLPEEGLSVTTGENGQFHFPGLVPGTYNLYCAAVGHVPVAKSAIEVAQGKTPFIQVVLPIESVVRENV